MGPPYRLILFDFDGTLVDTVGDIAYHANCVLVKRGYEACSIARVKEAVGWGVHELFKCLAPAVGEDPAGLDEAVDEFKRAYRAQPVRETLPFPGVVGMLEGPLGKTLKAIVTNKPQDITLRILDELGIARFFKHVIGMHEGFPPKPDPAGIREMMDRFGADAGSTVYVGDSCVDAETSLAAGVDFAYVEYGYQALKGYEPAFRFSSAAEWRALAAVK